ncbi:unnamed protein product, partial [Heterotrigona itama]
MRLKRCPLFRKRVGRIRSISRKPVTSLVSLELHDSWLLITLAGARMLETEERGYFHWADWLVFALMLGVSAAAGLWHYKGTQKSSTEDYLLGGKSMNLLPVSASLVASFISGVTILGTPAEIYNFGTQYWITIISIFFSGLVVALVYAPVFVSLGLNSVYEGGIRAVVWTDALQVGVMVAAMLTVSILGTYHIGTAEIWKVSSDTNRIEFLNFDPSPYTRHTVWTVLIGSWLYSTAYIAVNQTMVQRYRLLKDLKTSKLSLAIFTISIMLFISLCCWCGLVLIAWWSPPKCDPRAIGLITADDQLLPAFVMEIANHLPGIPGLFISGIFGAALSTLSVGFNSTAVVILEDFVKGCCGMKPTDRCSNIFVKCVIVLLGSLALGLLFLVEKLGGVLAGAFMGAIVGFVIAGWASLGANWSIGAGLLVPKKLPVPLSHCTGNISESFLKQFDHPKLLRKRENIVPTESSAGTSDLATTASLLLYDLKKKR